MDQHQYLQFQNQVRHLVKQLVQPTARRTQQNRLSISTLRHILQSQATKISDLQIYLNKLEKKLEFLDELDKRVTDNQAQIRSMGTRFTTDRQHTQTELQGFHQRMTLMEQAYKVLDKQRQQMKLDIQIQAKSQIDLKVQFQGRLQFFKSELRTRFVSIEKHTYDQQVALQKHEVNLTEINEFNSEIDIICKRADMVSEKCKNQLQGVIQKVGIIKKENEKSVNNIRKMVIRFDAFAREKQKEVLKKVEDQLPVQQFLDSFDLFHLIIPDLKVKKRFAEYQLGVYKSWKDEKVAKNRERVQKAKQRVIEVIQAEVPPTPVASSSSDSSSYWSSQEEDFDQIREETFQVQSDQPQDYLKEEEKLNRQNKEAEDCNIVVKKEIQKRSNEEYQRPEISVESSDRIQTVLDFNVETPVKQTPTFSLLERNSGNSKIKRKGSFQSSDIQSIRSVQKEFEQESIQRKFQQDSKQEIVQQIKPQQIRASKNKKSAYIEKVMEQDLKRRNQEQKSKFNQPTAISKQINTPKNFETQQKKLDNSIYIQQLISDQNPDISSQQIHLVSQQQIEPSSLKQIQQEKPTKINPPKKIQPNKNKKYQQKFPIKQPLHIQKSPQFKPSISTLKSPQFKPSITTLKSPITPIKPSLPITPKIQKPTHQISPIKPTPSQSTPKNSPLKNPLQTQPLKKKKPSNSLSPFQSARPKNRSKKHKKRKIIPDLTPQFQQLTSNLQTIQSHISSLQLQLSQTRKECQLIQTKNTEQFFKYDSAFQYQQKSLKQFQQAFIKSRELMEKIYKKTKQQLAENSQDMRGLEQIVEIFKLEFKANNELLDIKFKEFQQITNKYCNQLQMSLQQTFNDFNQIVTQKRRESSDQLSIHKKIKKKQGKIIQKEKLIDQNIQKIKLNINSLNEFCRISALMSIQDEIDKDGISLIGLKEKPTRSPRLNKRSSSIQPGPVKDLLQLQSKCFSCSGQSSDVMSAFKLACLAYQPSKVLYCRQTYTRKELISLQQRILQGSCQSDFTSPSVTDFRPSTEFGVQSPSPFQVSQTPELPPILRKQWNK